MYRLLVHQGKDPRLRPIAVMYEPPDQLTPAEAGTLVDESPDTRDITATVVDLAVRGYVRISERKAEHLFGLWVEHGLYVFSGQSHGRNGRSYRPSSGSCWRLCSKDSEVDEILLSSLETASTNLSQGNTRRDIPVLQNARITASAPTG